MLVLEIGEFAKSMFLVQTSAPDMAKLPVHNKIGPVWLNIAPTTVCPVMRFASSWHTNVSAHETSPSPADKTKVIMKLDFLGFANPKNDKIWFSWSFFPKTKPSTTKRPRNTSQPARKDVFETTTPMFPPKTAKHAVVHMYASELSSKAFIVHPNLDFMVFYLSRMDGLVNEHGCRKREFCYLADYGKAGPFAGADLKLKKAGHIKTPAFLGFHLFLVVEFDVHVYCDRVITTDNVWGHATCATTTGILIHHALVCKVWLISGDIDVFD